MENIELNCKLHKSDFLKVGDVENGLTSISIIATRTGEIMGVCIDKDQIKELINHLNKII